MQTDHTTPARAKRAPPDLPKRAKSIDEFCATYGIGRNSAYNEIARGELKTIVVGRRRLITEAQEQAWIRSKESAA